MFRQPLRLLIVQSPRRLCARGSSLQLMHPVPCYREFSHSSVTYAKNPKQKKGKDNRGGKEQEASPRPRHEGPVELKFNLKKVEEAMKIQIEKLQVALVPVVGRAGRITDRFLDGVMIVQGDEKYPLREYASVAVQDARTLRIEVYSTDAVGLVNSALQNSHLKLSPNVGSTSNTLLVKIPPPDEKARETLARKAAETCEHTRTALRGLKNNAQKNIKSDEKENRSTKDDVFQDGKKLEEVTKKYTAEVDKIAAAAKKVCLDIA